DVYAIPSAKAILPFLSNPYSTVVRTRDGILFESQSPLPVPGGSTVMSALPAAAMLLGVRVARVGANDVRPIPMKPQPAAVPAPRTVVRRAGSLSKLQPVTLPLVK